ncbi:MAG: methylated-DNA--[protein]-cysteine S-methyltransferase [Ruminococcus sp.]|nr:methylated-DNA--[protein]-cysteine S-methyltransferase [Ruminococcus sp.]
MISIKSVCSIYQSPVGILTIVNDGFYLTHILYGNHSCDFTFEQNNPINTKVISELDEYFNGTRKVFDIPTKLDGTNFQKKVWNALSKIPYGETRSYGDIAKLIGKPDAVRAIGKANSKNPIAIIIPCHRVTNANGSLAGYSGGTYAKKRLLDLEKSTLADINQKLLSESKASSELLNVALLRTQIYGFYYYPQENLYLFPERTADKYEFKDRYEHVPKSFCNELIYFEDRQKFINMNKAIQDGEQSKTDIFRSTDEKYWWKITLSTAEYNQNGKPLITIGVVEDITKQKLIELEKDNLINLNQELLISLSDLFIGVHRLDLNTRTIKSVRMLHSMPEIEIDKDYNFEYWLDVFSTYYHPNDRKKLHNQFSFENILHKRNLGVHTIEDTYRRFMSDSYAWISNKIILNNKNFNSNFALIVQMDVSDTYQKTNIINALSNGYYAIYYLNLYDDTYEMLRSDKVVKNKINIQSIGCYSDVMHDYIYNFIHPEDRKKVEKFSDIINLRNQQKDNHNDISILFRKKVGIHYECVELKYIMNISDEPQFVVLALKNIDETMRHELDTKQLLKDALSSAESINHAKSQILSTISHDMYNPMKSISEMTTLAMANINDTEYVNSCLESISNSSKQLNSIMNKMLNISKMESTNFDLQYSQFSISKFIQSTLEVVHNSMKEKNLQFSYAFNNIYHDRIIGDMFRLQQFMTNILGNAIKFNNVGGSIHLIVEQSDVMENSIVRHKFIVKDTGIGISQNDIGRIFEPFFRANDERIQNISGTGLGLALVESIVKLMNGTIEVESTLNVGTTFTITLDLQIADDYNSNTTIDIPNVNILVLNNNVDELEYTCNCLKNLNLHTTAVTTSSEALDRLTLAHAQSNDYFAILIDSSIKDMNFLDLIRDIRENFGRQPLNVLVSLYDLTSLEESDKDFGIDAFIHKPIFCIQMLETFKKLTESLNTFYNKDYFAIRPLRDTKCLLIEQNRSHQNIDKEILRVLGSTVDIVSDSSEAISQIRNNNKYDYILMDINLTPIEDFKDVATIRKLDNFVPIIAMTPHYFSHNVKLAIESGIDTHLVRPIDSNINLLIDTIISNIRLAQRNKLELLFL